MSLTSNPSQFIAGDLRFSMWIPTEQAGVVVGKKGSMILNIQQETKTKLLEARKPITSSLWSPIMIHGEPCAVYAAYSAISSLVDNEVDDVVAEFLIDRRKHFFLISKRGPDFIKVLSAKTNVRVFVPDRETFTQPPGERSKLIHGTLEGRCEDVYRALDMLESEYILSLDRDSYAKTSTLAGMGMTSSSGFKLKSNPSDNIMTNSTSAVSNAKNLMVLNTSANAETVSLASAAIVSESAANEARANESEQSTSANTSKTISVSVNLARVLFASHHSAASNAHAASAINRMQSSTNTSIRVAQGDSAGDASANRSRRRRKVESDEDDEASDDPSDNMDAKILDEIKTESVMLRVTGTSSSVDQIVKYLERMVAGERIKDVLAVLNKDDARFSRTNNRSIPSNRGRGRGRGRGKMSAAGDRESASQSRKEAQAKDK